MRKNVKRGRGKSWRTVDVNVLGVAVAALLLSYSFSFAPPAVVVRNVSTMVGNATVGMNAAVDENPFNTLAQQLVEKERDLQGRESALDRREEILLVREAPFAIYSFILGLVVCLLVLANFFFDWRREKKRLTVGTLHA